MRAEYFIIAFDVANRASFTSAAKWLRRASEAKAKSGAEKLLQQQPTTDSNDGDSVSGNGDSAFPASRPMAGNALRGVAALDPALVKGENGICT